QLAKSIGFRNYGRLVQPLFFELGPDAHLDGVREPHLQFDRMALPNDSILVELQAARPTRDLARRLVPRPGVLALELEAPRLTFKVLEFELADKRFCPGLRERAGQAK